MAETGKFKGVRRLKKPAEVQLAGILVVEQMTGGVLPGLP
jgi:hypothetical protein